MRGLNIENVHSQSQFALDTHLAVGNAQSPQVQINLCAGCGIGPRMMMVQSDAEVFAHMVQLFGWQRQAAARALERAEKMPPRRIRPRFATAGQQYAPVKRGIVRQQHLSPFHERLHPGPDVTEGRGIFEHGPGQAVNFRKKHSR